MRKTLKINQIPILNFFDLQRAFSPLDIYDQAEEFLWFAAVHCVPLRLQLAHVTDQGKSYYNAEYLTKDFWLKLADGSLSDQYPAGGQADIAEWFFQLLREQFGDDNENALREAEDGLIAQKLEYICESGGLQEEYSKAAVLLAICELAEVNALRTEKEIWTRKETSGENEETVSLFPYEGTAYLPAKNAVYRYWYYEEDTLGEGSEIRTVRLEVRESEDLYAEVKIELYRESTRERVQTVCLRPGAPRYCNVADGKIIKILPSMSISDDLCLVRLPDESEHIKIIQKDAEAWTINGELVSSFFAGNRDQGFLLIRSGKVLTGYYKKARTYSLRIQLEMLPLPVVEGKIDQNGYELLLKDGTTIKENGSGSSERRVSLDQLSRAPLPVGKNFSEGDELAVSGSRSSAVIRRCSSGRETVYFANSEKKADISVSEGITYVEVR